MEWYLYRVVDSVVHDAALHQSMMAGMWNFYSGNGSRELNEVVFARDALGATGRTQCYRREFILAYEENILSDFANLRKWK